MDAMISSVDCPNCKNVCWLYLGDMEDLTLPDIEVVECWDCGHHFETLDDDGIPIDEKLVSKSFATPQQALEADI